MRELVSHVSRFTLPASRLATPRLLDDSPPMRNSAPTLEYDLAVIGGGSAGYAAARTASAAGLKTVVIEGGEEVGGLCILRGCMPTKALLYAAEVIHLSRHAKTWGIHAPRVSFSFAQVMLRKDG